jgi:hypothetical protein
VKNQELKAKEKQHAAGYGRKLSDASLPFNQTSAPSEKYLTFIEKLVESLQIDTEQLPQQ